jgi:hypothetical protein
VFAGESIDSRDGKPAGAISSVSFDASGNYFNKDLLINSTAAEESGQNGSPLDITDKSAWPAAFRSSPWVFDGDLPTLESAYGAAPVQSAEDVSLTLPEEFDGSYGALVSATVSLGRLEEGSKGIDVLMEIPEGFTVDSVESAVQGGQFDWNLSDGKLRIAQVAVAEGDALSLGASADAFAAKLKVASALQDGYALELSIGSVNVYASSEESESYDVSKTQASSAAQVSPTISVSARVLYEGDGLDLIPDGSKAVAFNVVKLPQGAGIELEGLKIYHSPELSAAAAAGEGIETFIALVGSDADIESFADAAFKTGQASETLLFGNAVKGSSGEEVVNADDALAVLSLWTRKISASADGQLLEANVNADARINTADVLAIVEYYVSGSAFAVLSK